MLTLDCHRLDLEALRGRVIRTEKGTNYGQVQQRGRQQPPQQRQGIGVLRTGASPARLSQKSGVRCSERLGTSTARGA